MENKDFAEVIWRMAGEQGKEILVNGKAKIFLADYCGGQFRKEKKIFLQILEANCGEHINSADDVLERKRKLMERLEDDEGLSQKETSGYLDLLGLILKGDTSKCGEAAPPVQPKSPVSQSAPLPAQTAPATPPKNAVPDNMVRINGGTFTMGSPANEPGHKGDETQYQVTVSGFYMGKYQVTQKEWQEVMGINPSYFKGDNLPVESVSWYDAVEYCNKRSQKEGLTPAYTINKNQSDPNNRNEYDNVKWTVIWNSNANGYRLPTEAEWEYACRAGTTTPFSTGNNITTSQANYDGKYPYNNNAKGEYREKTTAVGSFSPNAWGLYDMHGNVWEWCWDWYGDYSSGSQTDPVGAVTGANRVRRGGYWYSYGRLLRSACRNSNHPNYRNYDIGFRLVRP